MKKRTKEERIKVEPGADKRLADMFKKVLHTPPKHVPDRRTKRTKPSKG